MSQIGLLNEKPLHASLKDWISVPGDRLEEKVGRHVIDIVRDGLLIEVQTRSLGKLRGKIGKLLKTNRVRLVYPIALEKWIVKPGRSRRKSPKRGKVEDVFFEMVSIPQFIPHPNFSLEVLMIREEERRRHEAGRAWRRRGWVTEERRLIEVVDSISFDEPDDWIGLLPEKLEMPFTVKDLKDAKGFSSHLAQKMAYTLRKAGLIKLCGKRGRAHLYGENTPP